MVVFLFIGSGEVQPWAKKHPAERTIIEETPLAGKVFFSSNIQID